MRSFYYSTVESVITYDIAVWYVGCTVKDKKALQRVNKSAQEIISRLPPQQGKEDLCDMVIGSLTFCLLAEGTRF